jgi:hypothetical protein
MSSAASPPKRHEENGLINDNWRRLNLEVTHEEQKEDVCLSENQEESDVARSQFDMGSSST